MIEESQPMMSPAPTVLLVEDERAVARITRLLLESLGYRVIDAATATQALARLEEEPGIAILFSDIVLPGGMNGLELAEAAVARRPDLKVLFASGYPRDAISRENRLNPGMLLVPKPYRRLDLSRALDGLRPGTLTPPAASPWQAATGIQ
jgi:CheY-like chemotaxis protein